MSTGNKLQAPPIGKHVRHTVTYLGGGIVTVDGKITRSIDHGFFVEPDLFCVMLDNPGVYTVDLQIIDDTTPPAAAQPQGQWMIVEQLGHRKLAGLVQEVVYAGAGMLRLDIPAAGVDPGRTQYLSPASVYALHPVTEATARAAAASWRPEPVSPWELRAVEAGPHSNPPYDDGEVWGG